MVSVLNQDQLTRSQRTRIGYFEIWNNIFISINLAYFREICPPLVLSNWYLGSNFFCKGSDTSFTFLRCHRLLLFFSWSWVKTQTTLWPVIFWILLWHLFISLSFGGGLIQPLKYTSLPVETSAREENNLRFQKKLSARLLILPIKCGF